VLNITSISGTTHRVIWISNGYVDVKTVGCCSHIASIIYYLGYARYYEDPHPAVQLADIFPDAPPMIIDSDEEEA
jgi:hypothetical protein